jgi:hypothetical protein
VILHERAVRARLDRADPDLEIDRASAAELPAVVPVARLADPPAAILEAGGTGDVAVSWSSRTAAAPEGWHRVNTDQPHGAIAVYLCEPESDDGAAENGLIDAPVAGADHPIWRLPH